MSDVVARLAAVTAALLGAADGQQWDQVAALSAEQAEIIDAVRRDSVSLRLNDPARRERVEQLVADIRRAQALVRRKMQHLGDQAGDMKKRKRVAQTYSSLA
ncbi:MAG TPA: flagellar protein FliT [Gammaproteobacteria bacterium]|nr:flagellar protein FliT [Gammaproteobacteria bacterium]